MVKSYKIEAQKILDQNIVLSEQMKSTFLGGECLLTAGKFYSEHEEYELAITYLSKALLLFQRYDGIEWKKAVAKTQVVFGSVYQIQADFASALVSYLSAEEIFTLIRDYAALSDVLSKIGNCYLQMNQIEDAAIYAKKNLKITDNQI
jgi:tetratricopeptide (TPR) repeat protein